MSNKISHYHKNLLIIGSLMLTLVVLTTGCTPNNGNNHITEKKQSNTSVEIGGIEFKKSDVDPEKKEMAQPLSQAIFAEMKSCNQQYFKFDQSMQLELDACYKSIDVKLEKLGIKEEAKPVF